MNFSYPGDNLHLENHSLGEESFWPSFTDIMMVIVMVFLLVTVAVILNNWTLIANLKDSIKAQQVASHMAEEAQVENLGLDAKLTAVQKQLALAQQAKKEEHQKLLDTLARLAKTEQMVNQLSSTTEQQKIQLADLENNLSETKTSLATAQQTLQEKNTILTALTQQRDEKIEALKQSKSDAAAQLTALTMLQKDRAKLEANLLSLQKEKQSLEQQLSEANKSLNSIKISSNDAQAELQLLKKDRQEQGEALERLEQENQRVIANIKAELTKKFDVANKTLQSELESYKTKLSEAREQTAKLKKMLEEKDQMLVALQKERSKGESQLRSLRGEYDTLDSKYQKLLRPARSSKGKFIATVSYKKVAGKKTIRLKTGPDASYKTVTSKELHKALEKIKKKHGTDLYLKIIIPNDSGLSYNEAWRFTSNLQKKYDYYFQPDSKTDTKEKED